MSTLANIWREENVVVFQQTITPDTGTWATKPEYGNSRVMFEKTLRLSHRDRIINREVRCTEHFGCQRDRHIKDLTESQRMVSC